MISHQKLKILNPFCILLVFVVCSLAIFSASAADLIVNGEIVSVDDGDYGSHQLLLDSYTAIITFLDTNTIPEFGVSENFPDHDPLFMRVY